MAVFALPLIRQIKKSKTERSAQKPFVPIPDTEEAEVLQTPRKHQTFRSQPLPPKAEVKKNKTIPARTAIPCCLSRKNLRGDHHSRGEKETAMQGKERS